MKSIYTDAIMAHLLIALATTSLQAITIFTMGITQGMVFAMVAISLIQFPVMIYIVGNLWPTIKGGWSMARFWAGLFGVSRIGYERPGLSQVPWIVIAAGGMIILPMIGVNEYLLGNIERPNLLIYMAMGFVIYPAVGLLAYAIGYVFGGKRQRAKMTYSI